MARLITLPSYLRVVSVVGLLSLAFFLVSLDPFLNAAPVAGSTPPFSVNHFRKGDRLPVVNSGVSGRTGEVWRDNARGPSRLETREKAPPVGCDPAFSPVAAPSRIAIYGRCMV
jgi:hypothetical protein